jgi:hypothetical protein
MLIKKSFAYNCYAVISFLLFFFMIVIYLKFIILPVFFLVLGLVSYALSNRKALVCFLFLLPLINALPAITFNGYPFNYMAVSLFYLAGILLASRLKNEKLTPEFPAARIYLLFLTLLAISVFFVSLRWSNLTLSSLAVGADTMVIPAGERVSFAAIFPLLSLALFSLSPFLAVLLRSNDLKASEIFNPLRLGFSLSFMVALIQKWLNPGFLAQSWWGLTIDRVSGGFSDFNAFGFFSGVLFLYQALILLERLPGAAEKPGSFRVTLPGQGNWKGWIIDVFFLAITLSAVFLSGCRTAFIFVLLALLSFLLSKKITFFTKMAGILLLAALLLLAGGTLYKRLSHNLVQVRSVSANADWFLAGDILSSGRLNMLKDSMRMIGRFPLSGVGAGNFLFYLQYLNFDKNYYADLPLNQYLVLLTETGLSGGLLFIIFLATLFKRQRPGSIRFILAALALALLFNNFFWFPEALLLFWIFVSRLDVPPAAPRRLRLGLGLTLILIFIGSNVADFQILHPQAMARKVAVPYDYGLYYQERVKERQFRWTKEKAGIYIYLDRNGRSNDYRLFCGAPLFALKNRRQTVDIYWRGKFLKQVLFLQNNEVPLIIEDKINHDGFLEFRVHPAFNLKQMGLGDEARVLGVQLSAGKN